VRNAASGENLNHDHDASDERISRNPALKKTQKETKEKQKKRKEKA
jgi:hypothetical protein